MTEATCCWCGEGPDDEPGPVTRAEDGDLYHAGCWTSFIESTRPPTGPLVVVEFEAECPLCHHMVSVVTDGCRATVSTGGYAPAEVFREDDAEVLVRCGAPYADEPCGELVHVPLNDHDSWRAATDADRDALARYSVPVEVSR